ncbi:MAG: DUF3179 domain-containing protein [Chloroflexi bacterium]|nr:DUF3179 domain-containing protein [Chloroflexota bacterium]
MQNPFIRRLCAPLPAFALTCAVLVLAFSACVSTDTPTPTPAEARIPTPGATATPTAAVSALVPSASPTPTAAVSALVPSASPTPTAAVSTLVASATPTPTLDPNVVRNAYSVEADPDYEDGITGIYTRIWETDFRFHTVPYHEIVSGGVGRDGIPPIDEPTFVSLTDAREWLSDTEPVIALELHGEAKAYPLQVLLWHEIVNDELAGLPVTVTYCPLCNSAVVFDRTLDGTIYDFGVSGNLRNSDLVMWDRQTQSWWQQLTGEGIAGELAGAQLRFLPAQIVSWAAFRDGYADGLVLDRPGFSRSYGRNPYPYYDNLDSYPFLFYGEADPRLPPKERVAAVEISGDAAAFPYSVLATKRVVHSEVGGEDLVVFFEFGTGTALGSGTIAGAADVGATGVFRPVLDGDRLTFAFDGDGITDEGTGSRWNVLGRAVSGPLAGRQLERLNAQDHLWFAWAAFKPHTTVYGEG